MDNKTRKEKLKANGITTITLTIDINSEIYEKFKELSKYKYATSVKKSIAQLMTDFVNEHEKNID